MGLASKQLLLILFTMINNINKDVLIRIVAEWLEEWEFPSLIPRNGYGRQRYRMEQTFKKLL